MNEPLPSSQNATSVPQVTPIAAAEQQQVIAHVQHWLHVASEHYQRDFPLIPILFDLRGRCAGMYRVKPAAKHGTYSSNKFKNKPLAKARSSSIPGVLSKIWPLLQAGKTTQYVREIRFNPWLFAKDFQGHVAETTPP